MNKFYDAATIKVTEENGRELYEHQLDAMKKLNAMNKKTSFSTLLVLPTGGGKTMTSTVWLLKNAVDEEKKILWIAHRHLLLEQAAESFIKNANTTHLRNVNKFSYRVISGRHDRPVNIDKMDDILIASKDSLIRNLSYIDKWLKDEKEIYLVIDEAHHSIAKSYREIIMYVQSKIKNVKMIGLTATPIRTSSEEEGLLGKLFYDDIVYKIDLKELINRTILARPEFEECQTKILIDETLGLKALRSIEYMDKIPKDIAESLASDGKRNRIIVNQYIAHKEKYQKTIVFALNRLTAFALKAVFEEHRVDAGVIVSGTSAEFIGIDISNKLNEENIQKFKDNKIDVLINVNILTEGIDLPQTHTIFLTRPTVSTILMTQMIGRGLRGEKAGGTKEAYIVSFVDEWREKIAWANPETVIDTDPPVFPDSSSPHAETNYRIISLSKLEEFVRLFDRTIDTRDLENLVFIKRIPLGFYFFEYLEMTQEDEEIERNHRILVYDSTKNQYEKLIEELPVIFKEYEIDDEILCDDKLDMLLKICEETYFPKKIIPTYDRRDIRALLKYYAQKRCAIEFIGFSEIDREVLDLSIIAKKIVEEDMGEKTKKNYILKIWDKKIVVKTYYNKFIFFKDQLQKEIDKIIYGLGPEIVKGGIVVGNPIDPKKLSLYKTKEMFPEYYDELIDYINNNYKTITGEYFCAKCGKQSKYRGLFQIDHIFPMSKGGLSTCENLQLLCSSCNFIKTDNN